MKEFETPIQRDFWRHQIKQDNKAIKKIEEAGRRADFREIRRAVKRWRKEEANDRRNFNKRFWKE